MKKVSLNIGISFLSQIVAFVYGLVLPRMILGKYGSEINGLTQSITQFLGVIHFLDMGLGQVVCSSLYAPLVKKDYIQVSKILLSGRRFYARIGYTLVAYVVLLIFIYPRLVSEQFSWAYTAGLIFVISISSFSQYFWGITNELLLHADQKNYLTYAFQIFGNIFSMIACIWIIRSDCPIHIVKLSTACIFLLKPLFYGLYVRKHYPIDRKIHYTKEPIPQKWHGISQHVSAVVLDGTDNIVLTLFSSLSNVSIYSIYFMVISSIQGFYSALVTGIQSAAGAAWARQDQKQIMQMFSSVEVGLHAITVFLFGCTGILLVPFIRVYTIGLTDANYIQPSFAATLVMAYAIRCLRTPYNIWILAAGHFRQTQFCHITTAALNLIISMIAVFRFGLIGVAIGTLIAMFYQTAWMIVYTTSKLVRCTKGHILKQFVADSTEVALICFVASKITLQELSYFGWLWMAAKVAVVALVCIIITTAVFYRGNIQKVVNYIKHSII